MEALVPLPNIAVDYLANGSERVLVNPAFVSSVEVAYVPGHMLHPDAVAVHVCVVGRALPVYVPLEDGESGGDALARVCRMLGMPGRPL